MISSGIHFKNRERIFLLQLLVFKSEIGMGYDYDGRAQKVSSLKYPNWCIAL